MKHLSRVVLAAALLGAGCGGPDADAPAPSIAPSVTPSTAPPTSTAPSAEPSPTTPALAAANGRRLKSCADGVCEVIVESGDKLPNDSGFGAVNVTVKGGYVTISKTTSNGFSSTLRGNQGTIQQLNDQVFVIVAVDGPRAVLSMSKK